MRILIGNSGVALILANIVFFIKDEVPSINEMVTKVVYT
jgi:hypothetical protein